MPGWLGTPGPPGSPGRPGFEPFRRLRLDRVRLPRGSGIGLSVVRAIAEAHGGSATARPLEQGALAIAVELPAAATVRAPGTAG
ncbi:ATP-binding protein [Saccharopolyspora sp. MS10]|uniref:ATP-binding protein n=1 Tax=Saccharopolyspora sp. MS10 TaxID=3385973 RepID=UPI0039A301BA